MESLWANLSYTLCGLAIQPVWASISNLHIWPQATPLGTSQSRFYRAFPRRGDFIRDGKKNMKTIISGRVLQGLDGDGIDVLKEGILADMTTLQERSKHLGWMAIPSTVGNILGPTVEDLFSNCASWRWIGWINLPFLGIGASLIFFFLGLRPVPLEATHTEN